jgi:hypothetical protein
VSFAIAHGATVYDVQRMLGHSKPSITLDVYGERWEGSQERLADALDVALGHGGGPIVARQGTIVNGVSQ